MVFRSSSMHVPMYFMIDSGTNALEEGIERGRAYKSAGADCVYPVTISSYEAISRFVSEVAMPVNVLLMKSIPDLKRLKEIGVARVSLGRICLPMYWQQ